MPSPANERDLQSLNIEFNRQFRSVMSDAQYMAVWQSLATQTSSGTRTNEYGWTDQLKELQWEDSPFALDFEELTNKAYQLTNQGVSRGISIPADDFNDDNLGQYSDAAEKLADQIPAAPWDHGAPNVPLGHAGTCRPRLRALWPSMGSRSSASTLSPTTRPTTTSASTMVTASGGSWSTAAIRFSRSSTSGDKPRCLRRGSGPPMGTSSTRAPTTGKPGTVRRSAIRSLSSPSPSRAP